MVFEQIADSIESTERITGPQAFWLLACLGLFALEVWGCSHLEQFGQAAIERARQAPAAVQAEQNCCGAAAL